MLIRRSNERGYADHGWLKSYHTFSFANYYDPAHMGFRALRVINEDRVEPGRGFGTHPHNNMEIITYVLQGELQHRDSMGNGSIIRPGEVQRMSAGTGVTHSEYNPSPSHGVHFLQIWILPERRGIEPSYEQKSFPIEDRTGKLCLLASNDGRPEAVRVHQDVSLFASVLEEGIHVEYPLKNGRFAWLHVARGAVTVNGTKLEAGDAAAFDRGDNIRVEGASKGEVLLFDLC